MASSRCSRRPCPWPSRSGSRPTWPATARPPWRSARRSARERAAPGRWTHEPAGTLVPTQARRGAVPDTPPPEEAARPADPPQADAEPHVVSDEELPDPESLPPGSDFSRYLQEGVSQALRRRALRRLWQADHYGVRDGLDDYDDDYSQLEPLAREAAERLRHRGRRVNDFLDQEEEAAEASTGQEGAPEEPLDATPPDPSPSLDEGEWDETQRPSYIRKDRQ